MKNSDDVLTKIKRFFDVNGAISQGKVSQLMTNYMLQTEEEKLDTKVKESTIARNNNSANKNGAEFARGLAQGLSESVTMNESVAEFEAMITDPLQELDEFILRECVGEFNNPYSLIESAYDDQFEDPIGAAHKLIEAASLLQD
jgi:hypothetical protein